MTVDFPKRLAAQFKRAAKKIFPTEQYAILLGTRGADKFLIEFLWMPDDLLDFATPDEVCCPSHWFSEAKKFAQANSLEILGDMHSHCYVESQDCSPSENDWDRSPGLNAFAKGECIHAICTVYTTKRGKRSRIRFWPVIKKIKTRES